MVRIIASLVLICVGLFAFYTVWAKPWHPWSREPLDEAVGIPKLFTGILRGALGMLFVGMGIVGILRTLKILSE
jgi:hypothetical protein